MSRDQQSQALVPPRAVVRQQPGLRPVRGGEAPRQSVQPVPARAANVPAPQVTPEQFDVPTLIGDIDSGLRSLQGNAAGFAALNRAAEDKMTDGGAPIMVWAANFGGKPVEVQTDLAGLTADERGPVFEALIALHGEQMLEAAERISAASTALVHSLRMSKELVTAEANTDEALPEDRQTAE